MKLNIGRRKSKDIFPKGFYCYVGSGMNSLGTRILRHVSKYKKKHWHIDYLLDYADIIGIKTIPTIKRIECNISNLVDKISDGRPAKGFGSSDCKCQTHLYYFKENPLANEKFLSVFELH
jgi:sugar fermentation stimulation protein A